MNIIHFLCFLLVSYPSWCWAQRDSSICFLEVDFEYGSRPKRACKNSESHYFGGLHGGHVSVIFRGKSYGFMPTSSPVHLFPKKKRAALFTFQYEKTEEREQTVGIKTLTVQIPLSVSQARQLDSIVERYTDSVPYDYAFFGMRCASSTREILGELGIMKQRKNGSYVLGNFYPKRLRKRVIRLAKKRNYPMTSTEGRPCRKWERD